MSQIHKGIFAASAIALTLGAVSFAFAHDVGGLQTALAGPETGINRAAKADRAALKPSPGPTRTVALKFDGMADTSVMIRLPVAQESRARPVPAKPSKAVVACEPVVSVLTEVAKLLQPGRCVT